MQAWSMSTPGMTGKRGKWSARYSSPRARNLDAFSDFPGSQASIRSIRWNRIGVFVSTSLAAGRRFLDRVPQKRWKYTAGGRNEQPPREQGVKPHDSDGRRTMKIKTE